MIGVVTINPDTRREFDALRRTMYRYKDRRASAVRGLGGRAVQAVWSCRQHSLFAFVRGSRLVVTSFSQRFTPAHARRIAALVAPRI